MSLSQNWNPQFHPQVSQEQMRALNEIQQPGIVKDDTVTSMQNKLADEIVTLRDNIGALSKALSPVCLPPPGSDEVTNSAQPQHSLLSLAQLQTLIYQVRHAAQDVRDMLGGLRV